MQNDNKNNNQTTGKDVSDLCAAFAKQIDKLIEERIAKAEFDKTYYGMISAVCFDKNTEKTAKEYQMYQISYNGYTQDIYIRDGIIHSVGDRIKVTLPSGKYKDRYVDVLTTNDNPVTIELSSDKKKIIETQVNKVGKELTDEYIIERDDKGKVKTVTFPDGSVLNVKGF